MKFKEICKWIFTRWYFYGLIVFDLFVYDYTTPITSYYFGVLLGLTFYWFIAFLIGRIIYLKIVKSIKKEVKKK